MLGGYTPESPSGEVIRNVHEGKREADVRRSEKVWRITWMPWLHRNVRRMFRAAAGDHTSPEVHTRAVVGQRYRVRSVVRRKERRRFGRFSTPHRGRSGPNIRRDAICRVSLCDSCSKTLYGLIEGEVRRLQRRRYIKVPG